MKHFIFLMLTVGMLAGCGTRGQDRQAYNDALLERIVNKGQVHDRTEGQKGTAEVFDRDGAQWVRIIGSGVEFPLLGEWKSAEMIVTDKGHSVLRLIKSKTNLSAFMIYPAQSVDISLPRKIASEEILPDDAGKKACESINGTYVNNELLTPLAFMSFCGGGGWYAAPIFIEGKYFQQAEMDYYGRGDMHSQFYLTFKEMIRRVELH